MMLNQMPAGRAEPTWTQYDPGGDFEDCEWRVEEMELLGVKQRYIMIRGTITRTNNVHIDMPAGVSVYYPLTNAGFAIECSESDGNLRFLTTSVYVDMGSNIINFVNLFTVGTRFFLFARVK